MMLRSKIVKVTLAPAITCFILLSVISVAGQPTTLTDERDEFGRSVKTKFLFPDGSVGSTETIYHRNTTSSSSIAIEETTNTHFNPYSKVVSVVKFDPQGREISSSLIYYDRNERILSGQTLSYRYQNGEKVWQAQGAWDPDKGKWNLRKYDKSESKNPKTTNVPRNSDADQNTGMDDSWLLGTWKAGDPNNPFIIEFVREGDEIAGYLRKHDFWTDYYTYKLGEKVWRGMRVIQPRFVDRYEAEGECLNRNKGVAPEWFARQFVRVRTDDDEMQLNFDSGCWPTYFRILQGKNMTRVTQ